MTAPIATPCRKICVIDPATRLCGGCGRTLDEIARWSVLSPEERKRIMSELPARIARATPRSESASTRN